MTGAFECTRCERPGPRPVSRAPFPNDLGQRIVDEICSVCWDEWKERQMALINHHGLKLHQAEARDFLYAHLRSFLFGEGDLDTDIDPGQQGSVEW